MEFDFKNIESMSDFYRQLGEKSILPDYFGNNLDALSDCLTGYFRLPLDIRFVGMSMFQLEQFEPLIQTIEDAVQQVDRLSFEYFLN